MLLVVHVIMMGCRWKMLISNGGQIWGMTSGKELPMNNPHTPWHNSSWRKEVDCKLLWLNELSCVASVTQHVVLCSPFRASTAKSRSRLPSMLAVLPACTGWSGPPAPTAGSRAASSHWPSMERWLIWGPGHWGRLSVVLTWVSVTVVGSLIRD